MALVPCRQCRQPFYASCHDGSCFEALCPSCEYGEEVLAATPGPAPGSLTGRVPGAPVVKTRVGSVSVPAVRIVT
jgi:hypothetical protein